MTMRTGRVGTAPPLPEPDIEPRLLRAFLAVAREAHFGHAAAELGVAQPALSKQVRQLERLLGVELFDRTPRGAELTRAGRLVLPEAQRALAQNRRLMRTARAAATGRSEGLTVSAPLPSPPGGLLAEAVRGFRSTQQDVGVSVVGLDDGEEAAALADGRVDALLTWDLPASEVFAFEVLVEERTSALLTQDHPWAHRAQIPLTVLADDPVLFPLRERSHCWAQLHAAATAAGADLHPVPTAPSAVPDLVAAGLGVSAVPESFRLAGHPGVAFVPLPDLYGRMSVVWRGDDDAPAVAAFVTACRAAVRGLVAAHGDVWRIPGGHRHPAGKGRKDGGRPEHPRVDLVS